MRITPRTIPVNWLNYDANGDLLSVNTTEETYTYDDLNRLTGGNGPWGTLGYTYDIVGNRLSETVNGTETTYTIGTYNKLNSAGTIGFTYDNNGNRITKTDGGSSLWASYSNRDLVGRCLRIIQNASITNQKNGRGE